MTMNSPVTAAGRWLGYARVSTDAQDEALQVRDLEGLRPNAGVNDWGAGSWLVMLGDGSDRCRRFGVGSGRGLADWGRRV